MYKKQQEAFAPCCRPKTKKGIWLVDLDGLGLLMLRNNPVNVYREDSIFAVGSGDVPILGERESSAELAASDSSRS